MRFDWIRPAAMACIALGPACTVDKSTGRPESPHSTIRDIEDCTATSCERFARSIGVFITSPMPALKRIKTLLWPRKIFSHCAATHPICEGEGGDFAQLYPYAIDHAWTPCTATLVAPDLVLTSGHCLLAGTAARRHVRFDWTRSTPLGDDEPRTIAVDPSSTVAVAERIPLAGVTKEIALLRLAQPMTGREVVPVVCGVKLEELTAIESLQHPFGSTLKYADGRICGTATPGVQLDIGGGSSGAAILQEGRVIGLLRGYARIDCDDCLGTHAGQQCYSLKFCPSTKPHPIDTLPDLVCDEIAKHQEPDHAHQLSDQVR